MRPPIQRLNLKNIHKQLLKHNLGISRDKTADLIEILTNQMLEAGQRNISRSERKTHQGTSRLHYGKSEDNHKTKVCYQQNQNEGISVVSPPDARTYCTITEATSSTTINKIHTEYEM